MTSVAKLPKLPRSLLTNSHLTKGVGQQSLRFVEVGRRVGVWYFSLGLTEPTPLILQKSESYLQGCSVLGRLVTSVVMVCRLRFVSFVRKLTVFN